MLFGVSRVPPSLLLPLPVIPRRETNLADRYGATAADATSPSMVAIYAFIASRDESKMQLNERGTGKDNMLSQF